jgi:CRISPR-associated endonuclease/helicase Cas3
MNPNDRPTYLRYWGKADPTYRDEPKWHPLAYHCLDVAACGLVLLEVQPAWLSGAGRITWGSP